MSAYIKSIADVPQVDLNQLPRFKTNIPELDKCIGGILFGTVTILTGKRGNGKSTFMSQLICEAIDQGVKTFVYSGELADFHFKGWIDLQLAGKENLDSVQDEFGNMLYSIPTAITAKINDWYRERLYLYDKRYVPENGEYEKLETVIKDAVDEYGVRFVCIDNLMTAMETVSNINELNLAQSRFVGMLADIAKSRDVAILLVSHPKKGDSDDLNDWVSGSSDITNKADVVMTYKRVEGQDHDGELQISKSRFYGRYALGENAIKLTYSEATKRIASYEYGTKRRYGWAGDFSELDPDSEDAVIDLPFQGGGTLKETLSNYRYLFDEIKAWMIHREEILTMATKITASMNGMPSGSAESRKVETWAVKLAEVDDEIDRRVDMISKHLTSLTDYIYRLPPGNARNVLIYHYIDGLKFSEICVELRYSERQVYRLHRIGIEFLSKLAQDVSE